MEENAITYFPINYSAGDDGFVSKPHTHRHYEIFYFEKGNATHFIDFENFLITDNSFFLVSYDQIHYITAAPNTFNLGHVISISQGIIQLLDNDLLSLFGKFSQSPAFYIGKNEFISILFQQVQQELKQRETKSNELVFGFIKAILTYVWREQEKKPIEKSDKNDTYIGYLRLLDNNFTNIKSVKEYAEILNITTKQLNKICKEASHQTALSIIHHRINLEAKRKLFYSGNQVKDICFDLGFDDTGHYNNFFRKMNGKTPLEFRAQMSQIFN